MQHDGMVLVCIVPEYTIPQKRVFGNSPFGLFLQPAPKPAASSKFTAENGNVKPAAACYWFPQTDTPVPFGGCSLDSYKTHLYNRGTSGWRKPYGVPISGGVGGGRCEVVIGFLKV
jgi:hypothetical protein